MKKGKREMNLKKGFGKLGFIFYFSFFMLLTACDGSIYYDESRALNEHGWLPTDVLTFDVDVDDTVHQFDFLVGVRNTISYPYSNTFLFITTTFPDGSVAYDTLECPLADPAGRWYGKRVGRYVDSRYRLRGTSARFPMEGLYRFEVVNGMRDSAIAGLKDISLRIEYAKKK